MQPKPPNTTAFLTASPQVFCTAALFVPVIGISLATDNVGVVLSFKGSCLSSLVVYIIPGLAYIRLMQPSGFKALFGPWLLIVYGAGAAPRSRDGLRARQLHSFSRLLQCTVSWERTLRHTTSRRGKLIIEQRG